MAVLDDATQKLLCDLQNSITANVGEGTQTMGIPFHITLGSYSTDCESALVDKICHIASNTLKFDIQLTGYNHFADKVFYVETQIPTELLSLRKRFENDYAHSFEWKPHVTLYCGDEGQVKSAMQVAPKLDFPIDTRIVGIELGEFFPMRKIVRVDFKNKD